LIIDRVWASKTEASVVGFRSTKTRQHDNTSGGDEQVH